MCRGAETGVQDRGITDAVAVPFSVSLQHDDVLDLCGSHTLAALSMVCLADCHFSSTAVNSNGFNQNRVERAGIRVNAIRPVIITTPLHNAHTEREKFEALAKDKQLAGRAGTSQEVAKLAVFLLSDDASFVTGSMYDIDGGFALTAGVAPSWARTNLPRPESS